MEVWLVFHPFAPANAKGFNSQTVSPGSQTEVLSVLFKV